MKTNKLFLCLFCLASLIQTIYCQTWDLNGNTTSGQFIGTINTQPFPIFTDNIERMRVAANGNVGIGTTSPTQLLHLNSTSSLQVAAHFTNSATGTSGLIVGVDNTGDAIVWQSASGADLFFSVGLNTRAKMYNVNGNMALGAVTSFNPQSMLHLYPGDVQQAYIQIAEFSCGTGSADGFKIGVNSTSGTLFAELRMQEQAAMNFYTDNTERVRILGNNGYVGIGTSSPGVRLDVDGEAAIRTVNNNNTLTRLLVSDNSNGGVIKYRDANTFASVCSTGTVNRLTKWTSTSPNTICNSIVFDDGTNVGIGTTSPAAHVDIVNVVAQYGVRAHTTLSGGLANYGVEGRSLGTGALFNVGVSGGQTANGNTLNMGIVGVASGNNNYNFGGYFNAGGGKCVTSYNNYGIYAVAAKLSNSFTPNCTPGIAGYFDGFSLSTAGHFTISDAKFKDSIITISNALSVIAKLHPKQYIYNVDSFPSVNLPYGQHYGVLAEQIDTVIPSAVTTFNHPAQYDSSGTLLYDSINYKGVNYMELIPLAIRGIQQLDTLLMQKTSTNISKADSNYVVKWNTTDKTLTKGSIYDRGTHIGIPTVDTTNYVTVASSARQVVLGVSSSNTTATQVVSATYSTNGNANQVAAVKGYSKYTNASSADDGIGGLFEGGSSGVKGTATGAIIAPMGVMGTAQNATYINMGVAGFAESSTSVRNAGVFGSAQNSSLTNYGVLANAHSSSRTSTNTGVNGSAGRSAYQNIGVHAQIIDTTGTNYGLYASVRGNATQHYAGYFNGDVHATGTVTWASDARLKSDIKEVNSTDALALVQRLQPKSYTFNKSSYPYLTLPQGNQYGLLAQDVEQVLPQLVSTITHPETKDAEDNTLSPQFEYKGVNYAGIIPLLVGAVKQQQTHIDSLEAVISNKLTALEERMNNCCAPGSHKRDEGEEEGSINRLQVELSTMQVVVLEQNVPNPFAEQTSISYFIPDGAGQAQVVFSDILGSVIKTVDVEPGYGIMTVFGQSLSKGQYTYSLLIDGKLIETRKMTKTK